MLKSGDISDIFRLSRYKRSTLGLDLALALVLWWVCGITTAHSAALSEISSGESARIIDPLDPAQSSQVNYYAWSDKVWSVSMQDGQVQVLPYEQKKDPELLSVEELPFDVPPDTALESNHVSIGAYPLEDGYYVRYYAGEFGASLWWFSKDGSQKKPVLPYGFSLSAISFVNKFLKTEDGEIYFLVGLSHMSMTQGGVIRMVDMGERGWRPSKYINLDSSADEYFKVDKENYLILTQKKVALFSLNGKSRTLYERLDEPHVGWGGNSIVQDNEGVIYIGGVYKVIRLTPLMGGYREDCIVPEFCEEWGSDGNGGHRCLSVSPAL